MHLVFDPAWAMAVAFTAIRIGVLLMLSPLMAGIRGLAVPRLLLTLALSVAMAPAAALPPATLEPGAVMLGALHEVAVGATMAFGVFAAFAAFSLAGKLVDVQAGFGIGGVYDPVTRSGAPLISTMLNQLAVVLFFGLDGHVALVRGIAFSLQEVPPGRGLAELALEPVLAQFGLMFSFGLALVIPVVLGLLLVEIGLAVTSRFLPQMNIFVVGAPLKIVAGIALLALTLATASPLMGRIFASIFRFWERVLAP